MTCRPGHPERHPDFEPGNQLHLVHGARSPRAIAERAEQVHAELVSVAPYLDEAHFAPAVARYLAAASREALLDEHIRRLCADKGASAVPSRVWEQVTACARLAAKLGQDLGLDPIGAARLRAVAGTAELTMRSLADLAESGRAIREARLAGIAQDRALGGLESGAAEELTELEP